MRNRFLSFFAVFALLLPACSTNDAMTESQIDHTYADCSNVDRQIAMLRNEKAQNDNRIAAGVGNFVPMSGIARFVTGRYETNSQISTGEWARHIDMKLGELQRIKTNCAAAQSTNTH